MAKLLLGIALAIAITASLDASGLTQFSALPLIPLFILFALLDRLSRKELGLTLGRPADYGLVLAHPVGHMEMNVAMILAGGPALFLLGSGFFRWMTCGDTPVSHAIGFMLIGLTAAIFWEGAPVALSAATSLALCFVGAWEAIRRRRMYRPAAHPAH